MVDQSPENHINGRGVQWRREQDQDRLDGVDRDAGDVGMGYGSSDVSDYLDCDGTVRAGMIGLGKYGSAGPLTNSAQNECDKVPCLIPDQLVEVERSS